MRLRDYHQKTNPVLDIFRRKEYVVTVDARPDRDTSSRRSGSGSACRPAHRGQGSRQRRPR